MYREQLEKNEIISFVPAGNSMWPFLKNRNQSVVIGLKKERLKKYDVAFYMRDENKPVLHRVIKVLEDGYIMRGDSQVTPEKVIEDNVFGILKGYYKGKKYIEVPNKRYLKKVEKWVNSKKFRPFILKKFYQSIGIKNKLKKMFGGKKENV